MRARARLTWAIALASGPCSALGCNVYDDQLLGAAAPLGGSSPSGGSTSEGGDGSGGTSVSKAGSGSAGTDSMAGSSNEGATSGAGGSAGTAAGGTSSGGSAGTGGTPVASDAEAIDDMEDNDAQIGAAPSRNGYWYVGNDGTVDATQDPKVNAFAMTELPNGERATSGFAAHMAVAGFKAWGSVIGFNFTEQLAKVKPYDATAYCGIQYWGKALSAVTLRFRIPDGDTHPEGKVCMDQGTAGQACYDHFGVAAAFTTEWKQFKVMFADLEQIGTGYHPADMKLKADLLFSLEWALPGSGKAYEIWVDDVEFIKCL